MRFELLHVTLCFVMYFRSETLQVMVPVVFNFGQYLQVLVLLGSRLGGLGGSLNFARTRIVPY